MLARMSTQNPSGIRGPLADAARHVAVDIFRASVRSADFYIGRPWRATIRPHSDAITSTLRQLRYATRFYRFDSAGTRCALGRRVRFWGPVEIHLGNNCALFDDVIISGVGRVTIGDNSSIGHGTVIVAREEVVIGRDVMIAGNCYILDVDHRHQSDEVAIREQDLRIEPVHIGDDVWVGAHTVLLRGVHIGTGAVIGANSVVDEDIPPYAIAAGIPAQVKKYRTGHEVDGR